MPKIGFWQQLLGDVGYFEAAAINANADSIDMMSTAHAASVDHLSRQTRALHAMDHAQSKELARLRTMIGVLAELVAEQGTDRSEIELRMEAALDRLESKETMAKGIESHGPGGPYRGGASEGGGSSAPERKITCKRCSEEVLARRTTMTEQGAMCDRCFY
jgi:hypothetical protein